MLGREVKSVLIFVVYCKQILTLCVHNANVQDTYLANHVYDVKSAPSLMDCVVTCYAHSRCQSVGFEPQSLECHRHNHNSSSAPGSLVSSPGWIHSDISMWPESILGSCSGVTCGEDEECTVSRTGLPICTTIAASLDLTITAEAAVTPSCPHAPPSVRNANVNDGLKLVGSVRTYTCIPGYLDISTDEVTANTACLGNLTWSHTTLFCSGPWLRKETPSTFIKSYVQLTNEEVEQIYVNSSFIFQVKTCHDANFYFGKSPNLGKRIDDTLVFGGNINTQMWIGRCPHKEAQGIVSCTEYRPFWFRFQGHTISAGKGERVGAGKLMTCTNPHKKLINVSISTYLNNTGIWLFRKKTSG